MLRPPSGSTLFPYTTLFRSQRLPAAGAEWLCLRLEPLDADSLADYVLTRLQAAGYSGSQPLTPLQLELLREHSGGLPAAVPAVLERVLTLPRASQIGRAHV